MPRRLIPILGATLLAVLALWRAHAPDVPLSPITARGRVGPDFVERRGLEGAGDPAGEMDDMAAYARPDFDPDALHPEVRRFYERTSEYEMVCEVHWHRGFRLGAALASRVTTRLEQLDLPGPFEPGRLRLRSRILDVDPDADPRDGARAWIRTDAATGRAVFVALYASHVSGGERYTNIAVPLPGSNLSTVLRLDQLPVKWTGDEESAERGDGIELTTHAPGDPGLYLRTPIGQFELPLAQRFRTWPAGAPGAPDPPDAAETDVDLVARHEMWLFGRRFLTIRYGIRRTS